MSAAEEQVVIVGGGPAGCTLAALLAMRGIAVVVCDDEKRPELLVGESLLPTVVAVLRRLGIEERAAAFCERKPGVGLIDAFGGRVDFQFPAGAFGDLPNYAYNVPRPQFDDLLRARAVELGVRFVSHRAVVVVGGPGEPELVLSAASQEALGLGRRPALLVDATGRARTFARALGVGARRGKRNDVAYFAHFEDFKDDSNQPGQVVISVLERGWSWRIPLPGRLSVGVVIPVARARELGATAAERLTNLIELEPVLRAAGARARRVSEVRTYTNYQLISERGHGPGWVMAGDAYGFVDPMLSPGLFMAMESATLLDRLVFAGGPAALADPARCAAGFDRYVAELEAWHAAWAELIEYFYDGRIFSLAEAGRKIRAASAANGLIARFDRLLTRQIAGMAAGVWTRRRTSRFMLKFFARYMLRDVRKPAEYAIPS
jgi:flavin-dependent dehydrogenase